MRNLERILAIDLHRFKKKKEFKPQDGTNWERKKTKYFFIFYLLICLYHSNPEAKERIISLWITSDGDGLVIIPIKKKEKIKIFNSCNSWTIIYLYLNPFALCNILTKKLYLGVLHGVNPRNPEAKNVLIQVIQRRN